jgi:hypothetical protein
MKKNFLFLSWTSLLDEQDFVESMTKCYKNAFKAIGSNQYYRWRNEDTQRMLEFSPRAIWGSKALWGDNLGAVAAKVFFEALDASSILKVKPEVAEKVRLLEKKYNIIFFSMLPKKRMLQEVLDNGFASYASAFFAPAEDELLEHKALFQQMLAKAGGAKVMVFAPREYELIAEERGCRFVEAKPKNLNLL